MKPSIVAGALALALVPGAASAEPVERAKVEAALPQIEAMAAKLVADGAVPGIAIAVVHADEVVYLGGFGLREVGKPETVDADTVFQLASMSKPISATVVAKLVSDGVVDWDSRIADLEPGVPAARPLPDRRGDRHRPASTTAAACPAPAATTSRRSASTARRSPRGCAWCRRRRASAPATPTPTPASPKARSPRRWPTGQAWETVAEERLYRPLGMASTSSRHADFVARPNRATLHVPWQGGWAALVDARARRAGAGRRRQRHRCATSRSGCGSSSRTGDWEGAPFIDAERARRDPRAAVRPRHNPVSGAASFYGRGWNVGVRPPRPVLGPRRRLQQRRAHPRHALPRRRARHRRAGQRLPDRGAGGHRRQLLRPGVRRQRLAGLGGGLGRGVRRPVRPGDRGGQGAPTPPAAAADRRRCRPRATSAATATTTSARRRSTADGETLTVRLGPDGVTAWPLTHFDRDIFLYYPDAGDARHAVGGALRRRPGRPRHRADPRVARLERPRDTDATVRSERPIELDLDRIVIGGRDESSSSVACRSSASNRGTRA